MRDLFRKVTFWRLEHTAILEESLVAVVYHPAYSLDGSPPPDREGAGKPALRDPPESPAPSSWLVKLVRILDDAIRIPGTRIRLGLDPILGLLPGIGDVVGGALTGSVIVEAARLGASPAVLLRMLGNLALDGLLGMVPLLGDLFDIGWKANRRNLILLEAHLRDPLTTHEASTAIVAGTVAAVLALVLGLVALTGRVAAAILGFF